MTEQTTTFLTHDSDAARADEFARALLEAGYRPWEPGDAPGVVVAGAEDALVREARARWPHALVVAAGPASVDTAAALLEAGAGDVAFDARDLALRVRIALARTGCCREGHGREAESLDLLAELAGDPGSCGAAPLLRSILDHVSTGILAVSASGTVAFANRRVAEIAGVPANRMVDEANARLVLGMAPMPLRALALRGLSGESVAAEEAAWRRPGGDDIAVRCSVMPIIEHGRVHGVVITGDDITGQVAEQKEKELLAAIVASFDDAIITRDLAGRVVSWNRGAERMYGYSAAEVIGGTLPPDFLDANDGGTPMDYAGGLGNFPGRRRSLQRRRKDGSVLDVEVHVFPVTNAAGEVVNFAGVSHDITERQLAEREIARLAAIVESSHDAIVSVTPAGIIDSWNRGAERMFGYARDEVVGQPLEFVAPGWEPLAHALPHLDDPNGWPSIDGLEVECRTRDGRVIEVSMSLFPVRDAAGKVVSIASIGRDVTEQKRAQAALRRREQEFKALAAHSPDIILRFDRRGRCVYANPAAAALASRDGAWFAGRAAEDLGLRTEPDLRPAIEAAAGGGSERSSDVRIDLPGGERWFDVRFVPETDEGGTPESVLLIGRDITGRRRAEQALRESEEMLAMTYGSTPVGIAVLDSEGCFLRLNRAAASIAGWEPGELAGQPFAPLLAPEDRERMRSEYLEMLAQEEPPPPVSETWRLLHRDGGERLVAATWARFDGPGGARYSVITASDITEQRRAEDALRRAESLLHEAVTSGPVILFTFDAEGIVTMAEGGAHPEDQIDPSETVGGSVFDLYAGTDGGVEAVRRVLRGERAGFEWHVRNRWYDFHLAPMHDRDGTVTGALGVATDVTERHVAEEARRRADSYYRAVVEGTSDALYVAERGADGRFRTVVVNAAYEQMLQRPATRVLGKTALEGLGDRRTAARVEARWEQAARTGEPVHWELTTPGGGFAVGQVTPLFEPDGQCRLVVGSLRDITALRGAEQARAVAEGRLQAVIDSAPLVVLAVDASRRITVWDGAALARLGLLPGELVGSGTDAFAEYGELPAALDRALGGEACHVSLLVRDARLEVDLAPVRDRNGGVAGVVGVGIDVTDRHLAERARERAEERLRTVAENAPIVLWAIDRNGTYTLCEGSVLASLGVTTSEVVGRSVFELYANNDAVTGQVRAGLAGEAGTMVTQLSERMWLETTVAPLYDAAGEVEGLIGVSVDVTKRLMAERGMLQAQKLESLGVLAGGIAHDFNNLLVGILGNAGLALAELPETSPARPTIEAIATAGQRAAELARQMLAYSGRGRFVVQRVDINGVVSEMLHLLRASVGKSIELQCDLAAALPYVEADATQLRQVIMNLVVNGSDAIGAEPGTVRVTTGVRAVTQDALTEAHLSPELPPGDYVAIEVTDSGSGMDEETLSRIFDPFFTTKFTGRGLGLAAVLGIVRGHRGAISVRSEPGAGSVFTLFLPVAAEANTADASAPSVSGAWHGEGCVLVVDDEETVRMVTARAVETFGFRALQAHDGLAGLEMFKQHANEVACVLLDMTMPRMNGEEAFHAIREVDPNAVIVLMSGFNEQEATSRFMGETLNGFIQKPYELATLREMLREVTARRAA
ncbi:MAG: PAS domain S-box protein [Dehalococcoidia bacterium]